MQKLRREEYLAKVRKLQVAKDRLSPVKRDAEDYAGLHDPHYDPSSELSYGFAFKPEPKETDFGVPRDGTSVAMTPPRNATSSSSQNVTLESMAALLDEKLAPVNQ
eukprot:674124-Karenia_brevis.AAC.1